jgi:5-methylcytosine-specific restriction endonuclease McrA
VQGKKAYRARRDYYITNNVRLKTERRLRYIQRVLEYLIEHPCVDCGENDPVVLDFDHKSDKVASISYLLGTVAGWERVEKEIEKCEVRCANCHRRKTARDQKWNKFMGL